MAKVDAPKRSGPVRHKKAFDASTPKERTGRGRDYAAKNDKHCQGWTNSKAYKQARRRHEAAVRREDKKRKAKSRMMKARQAKAMGKAPKRRSWDTDSDSDF